VTAYDSLDIYIVTELSTETNSIAVVDGSMNSTTIAVGAP